MHWLALQHPQLIHAASRRLTADQIHNSLFNAARATISGICSSRTHTLARTRQAPARPQLEHTPPAPVRRPQLISRHLESATCSGTGVKQASAALGGYLTGGQSRGSIAALVVERPQHSQHTRAALQEADPPVRLIRRRHSVHAPLRVGYAPV